MRKVRKPLDSREERDQADGLLVARAVRRHFRFAKQALEAGLRAGLPLPGAGREGDIEVLNACNSSIK